MNLPPALLCCLEFYLDGTVQCCEFSSEYTTLLQVITLLGLFEVVAALEFHPLLPIILEFGDRYHIKPKCKLLLAHAVDQWADLAVFEHLRLFQELRDLFYLTL